MAEKHEKEEHREYGSEERQAGIQSTDSSPGVDVKSDLRTVDAGISTDQIVVDEQESKRILRKVDYRLIPLLSLLYL